MENPNRLMRSSLDTLPMLLFRLRKKALKLLFSVALQKKALSLIFMKLPKLIRQPPGRAEKPLSVVALVMGLFQ
jgi:hypothetical protein